VTGCGTGATGTAETDPVAGVSATSDATTSGITSMSPAIIDAVTPFVVEYVSAP
jgi:hypothetical protein